MPPAQRDGPRSRRRVFRLIIQALLPARLKRSCTSSAATSVPQGMHISLQLKTALTSPTGPCGCHDRSQLVGRMSTDTPSGDLSWQPEVWDAARWREKENDARLSGRRRVAAGAVDRNGHLVAFTDIGVWPQVPIVAKQWNTIVDPVHRGHRLGLAVKIANLRNLRRDVPGALRLETWNAIENSRMIEINELLGFQVVERVDEYELAL